MEKRVAKSNLLHIYDNGTCAIMEFHNELMEIFKLVVVGGCAGAGWHLQVVLPELSQRAPCYCGAQKTCAVHECAYTF